VASMFEAKISKVLAEAVAGLDPLDRAERIAHCEATGQHGVTAHPEGGVTRFDWGGRTLAAVETAVLTDDTLKVPEAQFIPAVPDDARALLDDDEI
jgi:hypothetical protein